MALELTSGLKEIDLLRVWVFCMYVCMLTSCIFGSQKRGSDWSPETGVMDSGNIYVDTGTGYPGPIQEQQVILTMESGL